MSESAPSAPTSQRQPGIQIGQIFIEKVSFRHRGDPFLLPAGTPALVGDLRVQIEIGLNQEKTAGVTRVTVATDPSKDPIYDVELSIAGLFQQQEDVEGGMPLETFLTDHSIAVLYPFVREAFAAITQRGRFGPVWLNPFNTRALQSRVQSDEGQKPAG